ncbi:hypothetical protein PTSG_11123 [Salpingoeca rosetta]|uniref:Uncharacterized protein n=1 Tax=Salpingoeca rosetta (strain ATCC 50818 / BSB-021) TaxID=946362 RepID=F2US75_SALR5|nr:uncharacterized protein PTSG_11123 [Salpingoeca rosetta]EGD80480.1 hypothetical protein PTSG_11123 [Salpingoeca rosetta]|eukprot:XP_004988044.1 hypothetical protein PTSG_11123 [Salpingoeca rosetta]
MSSERFFHRVTSAFDAIFQERVAARTQPTASQAAIRANPVQEAGSIVDKNRCFTKDEPVVDAKGSHASTTKGSDDKEEKRGKKKKKKKKRKDPKVQLESHEDTNSGDAKKESEQQDNEQQDTQFVAQEEALPTSERPLLELLEGRATYILIAQRPSAIKSTATARQIKLTDLWRRATKASFLARPRKGKGAVLLRRNLRRSAAYQHGEEGIPDTCHGVVVRPQDCGQFTLEAMVRANEKLHRQWEAEYTRAEQVLKRTKGMHGEQRGTRGTVASIQPQTQQTPTQHGDKQNSAKVKKTKKAKRTTKKIKKGTQAGNRYTQHHQ